MARGDGVQLQGVQSRLRLPDGPLCCTYLGCDVDPVRWLLPPYGRGSAWCGRHIGPAEKAATIGYAVGTSAESRLLSELRRHPLNKNRSDR